VVRVKKHTIEEALMKKYWLACLLILALAPNLGYSQTSPKKIKYYVHVSGDDISHDVFTHNLMLELATYKDAIVVDEAESATVCILLSILTQTSQAGATFGYTVALTFYNKTITPADMVMLSDSDLESISKRTADSIIESFLVPLEKAYKKSLNPKL
jgi:hypothetical protein